MLLNHNDRMTDTASPGPSDDPTSASASPGQVVPTPSLSRWDRLRLMLYVLWLRVTLWFTPRPTTRAIRKLFAASAAPRAARQLATAPSDVAATIDTPYGPDKDMLMDVYVPPAAHDRRALPTIVWTHGGAFVGGTKDELGGYLRLLAAQGFTVVAVRYTLAPEGTYPTPIRQVMTALTCLTDQADRWHIDPTRLILAGDSAGAQITAQVTALVTNPTYAAELGITPGIDPSQLRGVELCCGVYDLAEVPDRGPFRHVIAAVGWAYSGNRRFRSDGAFTTSISIPARLTAAFPPAFVTAGNADPLLSQSESMVAALRHHEVAVEALFYPSDHQPRLGHEYQFDLDLAEGRAAFDRLVDFARRHTA